MQKRILKKHPVPTEVATKQDAKMGTVATQNVQVTAAMVQTAKMHAEPATDQILTVPQLAAVESKTAASKNL
jgi:hypothetical protein